MSQPPKRPVSLQEFANNLPHGAVSDGAAGRFVFGSRMQDTLPYWVEPGAEAVVSPEEAMTLPATCEAHTYTFDLSKSEHKAAYESILSGCASGWYRLKYVERHWNEETKAMFVYVEVQNWYRRIKATSTYDRLMEEMRGNKPLPIR